MNDTVRVEGAIEEELKRHGSIASRVRGNSMSPFFRHERDAVFLKKCDKELKKYDVVLYKNSDGRYVLHRIVKIKDNTLVIRGDNTYIKEYVEKDEVLAILDTFTRKGKHGGVNDFGYRLYSRLWCFVYPLRKLARMTRALLGRIYHKIFKGKKR